jgi:AcrR family transcriptional regulator
VAPTAGGPRARYREQTRGEIKEIALRQLAEGGISAIALTRIAKELGLSGPALYRYFAGHDDLVSALIRDAYDAIAARVGQAAEASAGQPPRDRLRALAGAYRAWALDQPHRYLLLFGSPLPGYSAPPDTLLRARAALEIGTLADTFGLA